MSKYGVKIGDKWEDLTFRNKQLVVDDEPGFFYAVYVGERWWGQVYDMGNSWTALVNAPGKMNMVEGFARRKDAAFYIINYWKAYGLNYMGASDNA